MPTFTPCPACQRPLREDHRCLLRSAEPVPATTAPPRRPRRVLRVLLLAPFAAFAMGVALDCGDEGPTTTGISATGIYIGAGGATGRYYFASVSGTTGTAGGEFGATSSTSSSTSASSGFTVSSSSSSSSSGVVVITSSSSTGF